MEKSVRNKIIDFIKKIPISYIVIVILLGYIFIQEGCNGRKTIQKGKEVVKYDTIYKPGEIKTKIVTEYKTKKGDIIYIPGKIDTVEVKVFENAPDTVQTQMYVDATRIRQYRQDFNDSLADVSIFAETKGELLKLAPKVTIKARLPEKKTVFALYGGGGLYLNSAFDVGYKVDVKFQNKKGSLFGASYDPINKVIFAEYNIRIFNIKK